MELFESKFPGTESPVRALRAPGSVAVRTSIKPIVASVGIGLAVYALFAYALLLFSVTQNVSRTTSPVIMITR